MAQCLASYGRRRANLEVLKVPTPLGTYNPDWAVLVEMDGAERLYFVVETKGGLFLDDLREKEQAKMECGEAHFKAIQLSVKAELLNQSRGPKLTDHAVNCFHRARFNQAHAGSSELANLPIKFQHRMAPGIAEVLHDDRPGSSSQPQPGKPGRSFAYECHDYRGGWLS